MPETIALADYLFTRLRQIGIQSIHGVPGDYNLTLLDHVKTAGLHWVGNCNELNAGYAADGYARIKGAGALITTFGVGELSALNSIAGAYAELARVVHIVGTPTRQQQQSRALIHHTLLDGDYSHFAKMYEPITVARANLADPQTSAREIDRVLQQCLLHSRPVYIQVPVDMVTAQLPADRLQLAIGLPEMLSSVVDDVLDRIMERVRSSKRPMILVDGEITAYGILTEVDQFIRKSAWPTWTTAFGKGKVNESLPTFNGIWKGRYSSADHQAYIKSADLILCFGPHFSGTNTYGGSTIPSEDVSVLIKATAIQVGDQTFRDVPAKTIMTALLDALRAASQGLERTDLPSFPRPSQIQTPAHDCAVNQESFYRVLSRWLRPGDIVLAETGTPGHGCRDMLLPRGARLLAPVTWLSIGYMLPATQGAALAQREMVEAQSQDAPQPRTILLIGDGSFQMTVQELSTIIRERLNVVLVLINNDGYTIERCIHGETETYNDVAPWRYLSAPAFFGAPDKGDKYRSVTGQVRTWGDLQEIMDSVDAVQIPQLAMVEVLMPREDAPEVLRDILSAQRAR